MTKPPFPLPSVDQGQTWPADLFGPEQLERHAIALAGSHQLATSGMSHQLLARLQQNEQILRAYNRATHAADQFRRVTHAAEWMLDNFYLIEEQIQIARRHLPREYSRELPRLRDGASAGLPRIYDIVRVLISHTDAQVDAESLHLFIGAYQTVTPLKLGELWAAPIMLRLALIETLRSVASRLTLARMDRDLADNWVDRLKDTADEHASNLVVTVAEMAKSDLPVSSSFVTEFYQRLSRQSPALQLARNWLEQRLSEHGLQLEALVHQESQSQAADQVAVSHSIASLRFLGATDWRAFVEKESFVERALHDDPAGVYAAMDFATRDRYRHSVEAVARYGALSEVDVAREAVRLSAQAAADHGREDRAAHVGYYLIGKGQPQLEERAAVRWPWRQRLERSVQNRPLIFYVGGIAFFSLVGIAVVLNQVRALGIAHVHLWWILPVLLLCSSQLAVSVVNWLTLLLVGPRLLPRLDFSEGIRADCRTMVVVPTLLTNAEAVSRLVETLEIHYLSNRDPNLHFALLTDFQDAATETLPEDDALVAQARAGIEGLNKKYHPDQGERFFLLHRPRRWNESEKLWMGYERKRGKLAEFNALLRGGPRDDFSLIVGDMAVLPGIKFVITLDTDTQLPRDSAQQLVGAIAHPLNRPKFDPVTGIVTEGYSILQPRVGVSLPSAGRSWFVRLFAGDVGIDPYTRATSDVYQDLFQEGSFIGKGIYDVDAFERAVAGRFPENTVLSHDLIESAHARSALISDVELYEEYPSRYNADINRRHRWIRGDWQIAQWLLPRVPGIDARRIANPLSGLSKWKIFDNLRRSLVPAALLVLLAGDWIWLPQFGGVGFLLFLAILLIPVLLSAVSDLVRRPEDVPFSLHASKAGRSLVRQLGQVVLTIAFLPYDAAVSLDAVGRTLLRLLLTRKRLLEWQTSSEAERTARTDLPGFYGTMWIAPVLAVASGVFLLLHTTRAAAPTPLIIALWCAAPWIAWRISQPLPPSQPDLDVKRRAYLRRTARMTWRFFEAFVTAEENWIPPDNFQEHPSPVTATRTSPTNLGLALLANLAATDFGYLSVGGLIQRTQNAFGTMGRLERHRGHFYNWYDTRTLRPLPPLYVSSVDSGNLAGHLLVLGPGLVEFSDLPILPEKWHAGLLDTAALLREHAQGRLNLRAIDAHLKHVPGTLRECLSLLRRLASETKTLLGELPPDGTANVQVDWWAHALDRAVHAHLDELLLLAPWLELSAAPPALVLAPDVRDPLAQLEHEPTLRRVAELAHSLCPQVEAVLGELSADITAAGETSRGWLEKLLQALRTASDRASQRIATLEDLARQGTEFAQMDFTFLFDAERNLFSIGYNVAEHRADQSYYDLLASEARLCSYVAIALGQIPQDHWFTLGRLLVTLNHSPILVSWSGSMFEYLMPLLVMPAYDHTLLDQTHRNAVTQQIEYGRMRHVPWGISESGYNLTDAQLNYQYRAFGVPGLGLKRGLASDLVIAPYATMMAVMVAPREACENLERLEAEERMGIYGFYEAVDYTPTRLPPGRTSVTVRSYMAHHQGMGLLALAYTLLDRPMQRRFMACPQFRATDLLLQERMPNVAARVLSDDLELDRSRKLGHLRGIDGSMRIFANAAAHPPEIHLLSNGRYHVAVSSGGGGYSRWRDLAVTRWREDATRDCWGTFLYLRDTESGEFWSAAHQPTLRMTKRSEAIFTQARVEFRQNEGGLDVHTAISVSPEDDLELRRVTLSNHGHSVRQIELTSYAEVVLAPAASDTAHPTFSNLFVQTEIVRPASALLATRRARAEGERPPWLFAMMVGQGGEQGEISCESDRAHFVGRGGVMSQPAALKAEGPLSNTAGSVLDPVVALRRTVKIAPGETARVDFIMGVTETRDAAVGLVEKYQNTRLADRAFDLAWTHSQVTLRHLNASETDAQLFSRVASALIYANPAHRAAPSVLRQNRRGQNGLWSYGISGDVPIALLRISDGARIGLVRQMVQAHSYWRLKGLTVELVILNEDQSGYRQPLQDEIVGLIASGIEAQMLDKPGGIFVRRLEQFSAEDRILLQSVARIVLLDENGSLAEQLDRPGASDPLIPALAPVRALYRDTPIALPPRELVFDNGLGGFTRDGREYVITLGPGETTPAPWVNVIANPYFGTVVSESGGAYTWVENCHEFRLTPWANDPVTDATGEAFYLRDDQTGQVWSPTPGPARGASPYVIRHGFGYTIFEHTENGIVSEMYVYVALDAPVKFVTIKVRNSSGRPRRISATGFWEWVLADLRHNSLLHVQTELDPKSGALLARNPYHAEFSERIVFLDVDDTARTVTGDRREFIGRSGSLANPAALRRTRLSGRVGAGLDPCGALQVVYELADGQERAVTFRLGVGRSSADVQTLIQRYRRPGANRAALEGVWQYWKQTVGAVQVETPDASVNLLANGWLLYQTLACRLWARTGFYQSGGAYGFRDQLQDVMALVHAEPTLTREHLLRAAAHQFREGDVQHWWHPPAGRGVRTHFSDDFLWLPYATCRYVESVADTEVLDERIPFLEGRPLKPEEEAYYDLPNRSDETATLYEHCVRAIEHGLKYGKHGLPLIGCGDWNDGMNLVGKEGRGESVWLAFFLCDVLGQFAELARGRHDLAFAEKCLAQRHDLRAAIEHYAWDGQWYRRAYFDDGTPLGSSTNEECQIDSLPQSWSVISGAGEAAHSRQAMEAVERRLVRREARLVQLFDPPFDHSALNPGYIKGYIPGVRENGGQYTHGALWTVMALALMGEVEKAWELFGLLNPIHHGSTPEQIARYKVEPYVVAADVYAVAPHTGRGGWTWYTGSAGWMYRLLIETLLGIHLTGDRLSLLPRLPASWPAIKITYRFRQTFYRISVDRIANNSPEQPSARLDGQPLTGKLIPLVNDRRDHTVEIRIVK